MTSRIEQFIRDRAAETYPEEESNIHRDITAQMLAIVGPMLPHGARILDVGCGQGYALRWFQEHGHRASGITTNAEDLRVCGEQGFEVKHCDMHWIGEHSVPEIFDMVWARHVLEHSVAPFFVLHEFASVLKLGGILYLEMPLCGTACNHHLNENHYSVLGKEMWLSLISRAGFDIAEARDIGMMTLAGPDQYLSVIARRPL